MIVILAALYSWLPALFLSAILFHFSKIAFRRSTPPAIVLTFKLVLIALALSFLCGFTLGIAVIDDIANVELWSWLDYFKLGIVGFIGGAFLPLVLSVFLARWQAFKNLRRIA